MASLLDFIIVFAVAFGVNSIPFAGPSNLLIPSWFPHLLVGADVAMTLTVGILVALGASLAKGVHYLITFFISGKLSKERRRRLDADAVKVRRWAFPLLYVVAATPLPDEPVIIPLGLMKYNPVKFFGAYFLGKITVGVAGALFFGQIETSLAGLIDPVYMALISVIITVVITVILLKVDLGKLMEKIIKKKSGSKKPIEQEN